MSNPTMQELLALIRDLSGEASREDNTPAILGESERQSLRENLRLLIENPDHPAVNENLRKWFKEKWVRFGPDGKIRGACARGGEGEGKPKCLPQSKAHSLGKKGRKYAASKKRREDPNPERRGKAINVATKRKSNEGIVKELNEFSISDGPSDNDERGYLLQLANDLGQALYVKPNKDRVASIKNKIESAGGSVKIIWNQDGSFQTVMYHPQYFKDGYLIKLVGDGQLDEACWKGYHKEGMKTMFGKRYPNCVKNKKRKVKESDDQRTLVDLTPQYPNYQVLTAEFMGIKQNKGRNNKPRAVFKIVTAQVKPGAGKTEKIEKALLSNKIISTEFERVKRQSRSPQQFEDTTQETGELHEKWSKKYKRSIDCDNPKGFSQRAHCQGRKKNESVEESHQCPHCGGPMYSEEMLNEKRDACYYKVKSRYKVWPSAYASGALVKCRKVGASKWGSKGK